MNRSESIKEIAAILPKAQSAIKAAIKDATNPHFRSKYADLTSVIDAVKEALNGNGITFLQPVSFTEAGVSVETVLLHTSGEWISESLTVPVSKQDAQGVGSAISYGRRYGLQSMCGVPADDDDDGNAAAASTKAAAEPKPDPETLKTLTKAAEKGKEAFYKAWHETPQDKRKLVSQSALADLKAKCEEADSAVAA